MPRKLNVAVVGCGYWGPNLIRNFSGLNADCRMSLVCDKREARLNHMRQLYPGIDTSTEFERVLDIDDIDAVAIATPVRFHYTMAKAALEAGKHVFIEKPMAASVAECADLVATAERGGLILMVGHTFIYSKPVRYIESLISSGELGAIQYISSRRLNLGLIQEDINVVWDLAPHDLSILLYVLKEAPIAVNCQGKSHVNGREDTTMLSLDFASGAFATVQSSWLDPNKVREMTIVGTKKMVVYDDNQPIEKIRIYDKRVEAPPHYDTFAEFQFSYHYGDMLVPWLEQAEPLKVECKHFLDCIRTGMTPESSGYAGMQVVQILEAANQSLKAQGARIEIDAHIPIAEESDLSEPVSTITGGQD